MAMRFLAPIGYFVALLTSTYSVAETWREGHETAPWAEIAVVLYAVQVRARPDAAPRCAAAFTE